MEFQCKMMLWPVGRNLLILHQFYFEFERPLTRLLTQGRVRIRLSNRQDLQLPLPLLVLVFGLLLLLLVLPLLEMIS